MLDLSEISHDRRFVSSGRSPSPPPMSSQQARSIAQELLSKGLPPSLKKALDLLSVGGAMTAYQMGVSPRTLRRYGELRVVDRLPHNTPVVVETFTQHDLPVPGDHKRLQIFALGPVGIEISKKRYACKPPTGYLGYTLERVMHDVIVNEIVLNIGQLAMTHGWRPIWVGEQEASLYQGDLQILKPDALIRLKQDDQERLFLVEYHNEDHSTRAAKKVQIYERAFNSGLWGEAWETDEFPPVLATFRKPVVGRGYQEGMAGRESVNCTFYGRVLASVLADINIWVNPNTGQREHIFPWPDNQVAVSDSRQLLETDE